MSVIFKCVEVLSIYLIILFILFTEIIISLKVLFLEHEEKLLKLRKLEDLITFKYIFNFVSTKNNMSNVIDYIITLYF